MLKNWKNLFVKDEGEEGTNRQTESDKSFSFPVDNYAANKHESLNAAAPPQANDADFREVLSVYENGLDSINMPGYDFYEFYMAISSTGLHNEQAYRMAYQMARSMDKTISSTKFLNDADFYISKINEVHGEYVRQGQQKLQTIQQQNASEKSQLNNEIESGISRINQLKAELQKIETDIANKRTLLSRIDEGSLPQEKAIREKLQANDQAHRVSINKLNAVKDSIRQFIRE
ncbi:hypothetical protein [Flavihumibacter petaseus]|uniref:Uncharacterized protein n=1 Tax=Flavihumibacter petaseus NBRC 106054 TaxID=1220578 RepID=A0A0E9MYB3_9BACT|nr:hypothetical protein [Flavihumibacter petaseus]GAO42120.1 hypothetical protein FPE01S_01_11330 [Flavihumibacter petaseus NBRC 106054]